MTFNEYQQEVRRTFNSNLSQRETIANMAMGLAGEAGETVDYVKKLLFHDKKGELTHIAKELGDVLWYATALAECYGLKLEVVALMNVEKLRLRYPEGFDVEKAKAHTGQ